MKKMQREEIQDILKKFTKGMSSQENYAYASGYYESMLLEIMTNLPRAEQAKFLDQITSSRFF